MAEGREDVIFGGALVLREVMRRFGLRECLASESDILDGLVMSIQTPRRVAAAGARDRVTSSPIGGRGLVEMEFVYDLTVDPDAENNAHAFTLEMIGHNKTVLEVGCATGYFTKVLSERGCKVVGMELDPDAAKVAERWADRVVVGNADDAAAWDLLDDESFDVITFGDVLEHLRDPVAVLRAATRKLKLTGFVVTSLPNVAHGDVRLSLLHGDFRYRETGLLDRTHVRFFTLETNARELLREAGLVVVDTQRVIVPLFHTEFGLSRADYSDAVLDEIRADAESETYQFVMQSVIDNGSQAVASMGNRLDALSDRVHELEVRNNILEAQVDACRRLRRAAGGAHTVRRADGGLDRAHGRIRTSRSGN